MRQAIIGVFIIGLIGLVAGRCLCPTFVPTEVTTRQTQVVMQSPVDDLLDQPCNPKKQCTGTLWLSYPGSGEDVIYVDFYSIKNMLKSNATFSFYNSDKVEGTPYFTLDSKSGNNPVIPYVPHSSKYVITFVYNMDVNTPNSEIATFTLMAGPIPK